VHEVLEAGKQLRLIDDSTSTLLHSVYVDGMNGTQSARRFHTSAGMIRVRCSKALRQLAAHAVELADAAA
jgi:DNA-directed RNA polymerase specialized sigma24 family protein